MTGSQKTRDMLGRDQLTQVSEARQRLLSELKAIIPPQETVELVQALGRISSQDITAPEDLPNTDRSTMDGYAVIAADTFGASQSLPAYLDITGEVFMGMMPEGAIHRGSCYKIPTGGLLPEGADGVVMHEHTVPVDEKLIEVVKGIGSGTNVIRKGDDIRLGDLAIAAGRRLRAQELGLLAGLGIAEISVFKKIRVGIVSTGDEIIDFKAPIAPGKIRNINSIVLSGLINQCGVEVVDYGIVADDESIFFSTLEKAVNETELVLFSGGSSVGMRDLGEQAIERMGQPGILVHGVSLKPGKPVIIGLCEHTPIFGLPGHPVSAMVCFDLFVRPAISALSGFPLDSTDFQAVVQARLMRNINSAAGRLDVIRVQLVEEEDTLLAYPVLGRSGAISTLSKAQGYFFIEEDSQGVNQEELVEVYLYQ